VSWNFDDTRWTGNNTGDGCVLFDSNDADPFANYAVCVTVEGGPPATIQAGSPKLYTCGNTRVDRCTGSVLLSGPYSTTCTVPAAQDTDPFGGAHTCNGADCTTKDTLTSCTIVTTDFGPGLTLEISDVCSYPSQQPNSDPSDCVFSPTTCMTDLDCDHLDAACGAGVCVTGQGGKRCEQTLSPVATVSGVCWCVRCRRVLQRRERRMPGQRLRAPGHYLW
jgi:hypothetical protein